jgi:hypothetical protein
MSKLSGIRDVDREILSKLDTANLLRACQIDKYTWNTVCDDLFLKRRLLSEYPEIEKYKLNTESWKQFFLRAVHTIAKMKEEYNYDYLFGNFVEQYKKLQENNGKFMDGGFAQASFIQPPLVDFLRNANFGNIAGTDIPLQFVLEPALKYGILNRVIVTILLTMYLKKLRYEDDKKYIRSGPEMNRYLGEYLNALEASDRDKAHPKPFDRNKFFYNRIHAIVQPGFRSRESLSSEEREYLKNDRVKALLFQIQDVVNAARDSF